jgi:hypothetical protein
VPSRIRNHIRSNLIGYVALFFALGGGAAWATHPGGVNTISSGDIINGEVQRPDVGVDSVDGPRIIDDSVRGIDVDESTLGAVPVAHLGGIGRWESKSGEGCDVPGQYFTCAFTTIDLPRRSRVLLIGTGKVHISTSTPQTTGHCLLATNLANIGGSTTGFTVPSGGDEHIALVATTVVGPGQVDFAIRCREESGNAVIFDAAIASVALSSG